MAYKSNMSVYSIGTTKTKLTSILKSPAFSAEHREKVKEAIINRVRFAVPKQDGLLAAIKAATMDELVPLNEFICYLSDSELDDASILKVIKDAHKIVNFLNERYKSLVETLLSINWLRRSPEVRQAFIDLLVDVVVAHNHYLQFAISKLIALWLPTEDTNPEIWYSGEPQDNQVVEELRLIHEIHDRIMNIIPMTFNATLEAIERHFPYFKKPVHFMVAYLYNILILIDRKPIFAEYLLNLIMSKLIILDVNAPRSEIIDLEDSDQEDDDNEEVEINNDNPDESSPMRHPVAQNLDLCMRMLFEYFNKKFDHNPNESVNKEDTGSNIKHLKLFDLVIKSFENSILPTYNTHYVQFILFYICSFKHSYAEMFLTNLWNKVKDPNCSPVFRQSSISYMASLMARSKYLNISIIKRYLNEFCLWAHEYIKNSNSNRQNGSLKAHIIFYSLCQAIFYIIAFRSRDLTVDKNSILFLQSLHLSALVNSNFNPLRACLPAVATAFAGVTRHFQLAYCHAILERNARRKLATVYANDTATPEEVLETFFPFDPYLLKASNKYISSIYLVYEPHEFDDSMEEQDVDKDSSTNNNVSPIKKRCNSDEDIVWDAEDKRLKMS